MLRSMSFIEMPRSALGGGSYTYHAWLPALALGAGSGGGAGAGAALPSASGTAEGSLNQKTSIKVDLNHPDTAEPLQALCHGHIVVWCRGRWRRRESL